MPLHGLLNRRVYLIDSAARNRYVPALVDSPGVRTIACLPMYAGMAPQGSLILVIVAPAVLLDQDVRALDQPIRELGRLIDLVRRQVSSVATQSRDLPPGGYAPAAKAPKPVPPGGHPTARTVATANPAAGHRERNPLEAETERLRRAPARDEARLGELTAEIDRLRGSLAEAEAGAAHERRAREELENALARAASAGRSELREALEAAGRAEAARSAALAENARLTAELEHLRPGGGDSEVSAADAAAEIDRLRARLAEAEAGAARERRAREELEAAVERDFSSHLERVGDDVDRLRAQVAEVELERGRLAAEVAGAAAVRQPLEQALAEVRTRAHESEALLAERQRELETLRAERAAEAARLDELAGEAASLRARVADLELERGRLAAEVEGGAAARARLEEALERGLADARAREQELGARIVEREGEVDALRSERAAEVGGHDELVAEADALRARVAELELERDRLAAEVEGAVAAREPSAERDQELEVIRAVPPDAKALEPADARAAAPEPDPQPTPDPARRPAARAAPATPSAAADGLTLVLDSAGKWQASGTSRRIAVVAPDEEAVGRASELEPADVLVNLAHPRALEIATELRAGGSAARFWGCVADAAAGQGVFLGLVEPLPRPLDPNCVLALLEPYGTESRRVLTVGEDVDAFISLRQALTRRRMSVSMAWNVKQAVDLLPMVRPHTVVLDLGLAPADTSPVVGLIAASTPLPITVLVAGTKDAAPVFAMALAAAVAAGPVAGLRELLGKMRVTRIS
jgi:hypothetical protein